LEEEVDMMGCKGGKKVYRRKGWEERGWNQGRRREY
jgi:hypothetical protein